MAQLLSCKFNMGIVCVELKFTDDTMISIVRTGLLIYNAPVGYADLILNGNPVKHLKNVTDYSPLD